MLALKLYFLQWPGFYKSLLKSIGDFHIYCSKQHGAGFKRVLCLPLFLGSSFVVLALFYNEDILQSAIFHEACSSLKAVGERKHVLKKTYISYFVHHNHHIDLPGVLPEISVGVTLRFLFKTKLCVYLYLIADLAQNSVFHSL